jgi:hypothetical protein
MTVCEAMECWQSLLTYEFDDEVCCHQSHEYYNSDKKMIVPKCDERVCERERAWRNYVRVRDNDPNFPFNKEWLI